MDEFGPNWSNYLELYTEMVSKYDNGYFAELGSFKGRSACHMGEQIRLQKKNIHLICVDLWPSYNEITLFSKYGAGQSAEIDYINSTQSLMQDFIDNLNKRNLRNIVFPIRSLVTEAAFIFPMNYFKFIFVDAGHSRDEVKANLNVWYHRLTKDGTIAGHDYDSPGVKQAVDNFFGESNIEVRFDNTWIYKGNK